MEKTRSRKRAVYSSKLDKLPSPRFYMFYLGKKPPKKYELHLSDAYLEPSWDLELVCHVLDITYGRMAAFLKNCPPLSGYSYFVHTVESRREAGKDLDEAIREAIVDCKKREVLSSVFDRYTEEEVAESMKLQWNADEARRFAEEEKEEAVAEECTNMILGMIREHLPLDSILRISNGTSEEVLAVAKKNGLAIE